MLDLASINTAPNAATLVVGSPAPKSDSLAASVGPTTDVKGGDGPDLWHRLWGKDGFSFSTLLDIVNPLQHIPVVSTIYQKATGDQASTGADLLGGALFGGPIGFAVSAIDSTIKGETGKDMGGHVLAMFDSGKAGATPAADTAVAQAEPAISTVVADNATSDGAPTDEPGGQPTASVAPTAASAPTPTPPSASDTSIVPEAKADTETTDAAVAAKPTALADVAAKPAADQKTASPASVPKPASVVQNAAPDMPKSAFVLAHSSPRSYSTGGIGNSFVPLETRSTIMPAAYFAPVPMGATGDKASDKAAALPDLKALAADPGLIAKFAPGAAQAMLGRTAKAATPTVAQGPTAGSDPLSAALAAEGSGGTAAAVPGTSGSGNGSDPEGFAALMARNLAHYRALQNQRPAPARINQRY